MRKFRFVPLLAAALLASGVAIPVHAQERGGEEFEETMARMLRGESAVSGDALAREVEEAAAHPLGSKDNPVRAQGPQGQRAYLARLRCANLERPAFERLGSVGDSRYGNIMDLYRVTCPDSEPAEREIYMDMYHAGHVEHRAVEGYGIVGSPAG